MAILSDNPLWEELGGRALGLVGYGGADVGGCVASVDAVGSGGVDEWHASWTRTAERLDRTGRECAEAGHAVSARESLMRASTYYRIAYLPLLGEPVDPRLSEGFARECAAFELAAGLTDPPMRSLEIPYEAGSLPARMSFADGSGEPRPTVLQVNGYDSNVHEMYFSNGPAANARGYNWIGFDGPGQGRNLIRDGLRMRPDWENVVGPVLDFVAELPEVDPDRIVLVGWSLGGFLAPRAAAFHSDRLAALVADPGQWDLRDNILPRLPLSDEQKSAFPDVDPSLFAPMEDWLRGPEADPLLHWRIVQRGFWVNGTETLYDYFRKMVEYEISPVAANISCPTAITQAEEDRISMGAEKLLDAVSGPKRLFRFTAEEGAGGHCEGLARRLYHQRVFDWLDETLSA